ncbi:hypothetical protein LINPERHAP2_LOCUS10757, partial [Linum perenne]
MRMLRMRGKMMEKLEMIMMIKVVTMIILKRMMVKVLTILRQPHLRRKMMARSLRKMMEKLLRMRGKMMEKMLMMRGKIKLLRMR